MNMGTAAVATIVFALALGWANAADTEPQTAQDSDVAQSAEATAEAAQSAKATENSETAKSAKKKKKKKKNKKEKKAQLAADDWDPDEVTCKRVAETGSRVKKRVCATNREWKRAEEDSQRTTKSLQRQGQIGVTN